MTQLPPADAAADTPATIKTYNPTDTVRAGGTLSQAIDALVEENRRLRELVEKQGQLIKALEERLASREGAGTRPPDSNTAPATEEPR